MTEDEMAGWHYLLNGHKFEQAPGDGGGKTVLWAVGFPWVTQGSSTSWESSCFAFD